jgi:uncharacterized protein with HEPN domain
MKREDVIRLISTRRGEIKRLGVKSLAFFGSVARNENHPTSLEVIGDAAKKIPDEMRERYPDIEWKKISGLRDIAIHEYYNMDEEILWDVVKNRIPELLEQVTEILTEADEEEPEDKNES